MLSSFPNYWSGLRNDRALRGSSLVSFDIPFIDDAIVGVTESDLCVIGADTGVGKTEFATAIAVNASQKARKVYFYSLESDRGEIENRLLYKRVAKHFFLERHRYSNEIHLNYRDFRLGKYEVCLKELIDQQTELIRADLACCEIHYRDGKFTARDFIKSLEQVSQEADLVILDHLHYFDAMGVESEIREITRAMDMIRDACLVHKKPVILVSHLRKKDRRFRGPLPTLDDFHGTSNIAKMATIAIILARAYDRELGKGLIPTYIHVAKFRHGGEMIPYVGLTGFNCKDHTYADNYYLCKVSKAGEEIKAIEDQKDLPWWATNATSYSGS
jgi:replicative DNA helicase